jgi:thiamine-phosphate pyrophosphorylase
MKCRDRAPVIGVSAHSVEAVGLAFSHGANFAVLAPIFEKPGTPVRGLGLEALREACAGFAAQDEFAVLALGGVTLANAGACMAAGATGVAGIRLFQSGSIEETVQVLRRPRRGLEIP